MLIIACGALAREITAVVRANAWSQVRVECLPADLHNHPERIPEAVRRKLERVDRARERVFVAYADCGTGGLLDQVLEAHGVQRLAGAHCYEFYAGAQVFAELAEAEPGTFYLTDFLARHFQRLVVTGLGLDRHPQLAALYFGNYRRLVYLAQREDPLLVERAQQAAARLGLTYEQRFAGYGDLQSSLVRFIGEERAWPN
jgi:hypothetical protein